MKLEDHPTVRRLSAAGEEQQAATTTLDGAWLRRLALDCGAHDSGLVELARPGLDSQRDEILRNSLDEVAFELCGSHVSRARARGAALRGQPRVPPSR
jgi:hypothetical protein